MDTIATTLVISRKKIVEITFVAASECLWKLLTAKPFDIHATWKLARRNLNNSSEWTKNAD